MAKATTKTDEKTYKVTTTGGDRLAQGTKLVLTASSW